MMNNNKGGLLFILSMSQTKNADVNLGDVSWFKFMYKNKVHDDFMSCIAWSTILLFAYACGYAYLKIRANAQTIRTNWIEYRCNPAYMMFAGNVMKPNGTFNEQMQFAETNFQYCVQNELKSISSVFMDPIHYTQSIAINTLHGIANALNDIRILINNIRDAVSSIVSDIMSRGLNVMQPIIGMFLKMRDTMGKVQGIMTASLYTVLGIYDTLQSGLRSTFEVIVIILIAMGAVIIALWVAVAIAIAFGPFGIPFVIASTASATVMTAIYIGIAVPLGIIAHFLAETMHIHGLSLVPDPPSK
jgi:hypothetical protein